MTDQSQARRRLKQIRSALCYLATTSIPSFQLTKVFLFGFTLRLEPVLEAPDEEYEIEYVYGFRTFDCRQNLYKTTFPLIYIF